MPLLDVTVQGSGVYVYYRNGEPTGVTEPWRRWREGERIVTESCRDAQVFGSRMTVRTEEDAQAYRRVTLHWEATDGSRWARADYREQAGVLRWQRSDSLGAPMESARHTLSLENA